MQPNPLEFIAPTIMFVMLVLTVGGVAILRPIAKRVGDLLEAMAKEKRDPSRGRAVPDACVIELLEALNARLDRLEERQDFTDSLLGSGREGKSLPAVPRVRAESTDAPV